MGIEHWDIIVLTQAKQDMKEITDRRIQEKLLLALRRLEYAPDQQGKALGAELIEYYSVRAVSQRYRIIYRLDTSIHTVFICGLGIRRDGNKEDVYARMKKRLRFGLFDFNIEIEKITETLIERPLIENLEGSASEQPALDLEYTSTLQERLAEQPEQDRSKEY